MTRLTGNNMGDLVSLNEYKKKLADKKLKEELDEINKLKEDLSELMKDLPPKEDMPYFYEPDIEIENLSERAAKILLSVLVSTLDGYGRWPIDSTDM